MPLLEIKENVQIYYEELGEGDRYLFSTQQSHGPSDLPRELAKRGFHVYLLTNRGFGRSSHVFGEPEKNWYDMWADDVVLFADKLGIDKFTYAGASHGAGSGWHLVLRHPERVNCFIAQVPGPHSLAEGTLSYKYMLEHGLVEPKPFTMPTDDPRLLERRARQEEMMKTDPDVLIDRALNEQPEAKNIMYGRPLTDLGSEEALKEALRSIEIPVLILGGTDDVISRPDLMIRSAENLKRCKTVLYSGFGHNIDIVEELADEAVRFYENYMNTGYIYAPVKNQ